MIRIPRVYKWTNVSLFGRMPVRNPSTTVREAVLMDWPVLWTNPLPQQKRNGNLSIWWKIKITSNMHVPTYRYFHRVDPKQRLEISRWSWEGEIYVPRISHSPLRTDDFVPHWPDIRADVQNEIIRRSRVSWENDNRQLRSWWKWWVSDVSCFVHGRQID